MSQQRQEECTIQSQPYATPLPPSHRTSPLGLMTILVVLGATTLHQMALHELGFLQQFSQICRA
jgi:hypothetical protein